MIDLNFLPATGALPIETVLAPGMQDNFPNLGQMDGNDTLPPSPPKPK